VEGVANAIQYTAPSEKVLNEVKNGAIIAYPTRQRHRRICYVVAKEGADTKKIAKAIKEMPYYFADYDTEVHFITQKELETKHNKMPHAGNVIRNGSTGDEHHTMEFRIRLDSNPDFTASIMIAYARAAFRLHNEKTYGAKTALDVPMSYLSPRTNNELVKEFL
jgi:diaminopimelate dehydrogenase